MDEPTRDRVRETFAASNDGRMHFGDVVARLLESGVESYTVDYRSRCTTLAFGNDDTLTLDDDAAPAQVGCDFDAEALRTSIRGAQQGDIRYPEFRRRSMQAGCVGYTAWLAGRQVTYFGRKGELHIERFPD